MNAAPDWTIGMVTMARWGTMGMKGTWVVECFWRGGVIFEKSWTLFIVWRRNERVVFNHIL